MEKPLDWNPAHNCSLLPVFLQYQLIPVREGKTITKEEPVTLVRTDAKNHFSIF